MDNPQKSFRNEEIVTPLTYAMNAAAPEGTPPRRFSDEYKCEKFP
jgi:hypothetical protein